MPKPAGFFCNLCIGSFIQSNSTFDSHGLYKKHNAHRCVSAGFTLFVKAIDLKKQTKIVIPIKYQRKTIEKPSQVLHQVKPSGWGYTRIWPPLSCCLRGPYSGKALPCRLSHPTLYIVVGAMHCVFPLHKGVRICHKIACGIWIHISLGGSLPYRCLQSLLQNM